MSEIITTEAIVLSKIKYGDTSKITTLYTEEFGKISAIVKGGRNSKSKIGAVVDPMNHIQIVLYKKDTREVQIISSAELLNHFRKIRENLEKLEYSQAILELLKKLTAEHESNHRLFKGSVRILTLLDTSNEIPIVTFGRFFIFFLSELGYEIQLDKCAFCGKTTLENIELSYNFEIGMLCNDCRKNHLESISISSELFKYMDCLKTNKRIESLDSRVPEKAVVFMERYLKFHIPDFSGIKSIQLFK